jgi:putative toxin-antitoxin system antitoxin component (TIGR02293 family)
MAFAREAAGRKEVLKQAAGLLGGDRVLGRRVRSPLDAHELIVGGLPAKALIHLIQRIEVLDRTVSLEKGVGMSLRTYQRHRESPAKPLTQDQGGRAWKFAELLARTTELLGSQQDAERWLEQPALGLDGRRPIDLLATPAGAELVEEFLTRLEYGVYV